jgi:RHS repeat-associated protein
VDGATKEDLLYDDLGRRIRKNGDYEHWDGRSLVAETDAASGGLLRGYTHGLTLLRENVLGNMVEAYTDGMGSVGALVPQNGTAANAGHYRYDAYGNFRTSAHPGDCKDDPSGLTCNAPLTYTGHLYDAESNLFYFGARYYDPETGRFLTNDPVAGDALNPPSLHKYLYAYDSPMVFTDPWGEYGWDDFKTDMVELNDIVVEFTKGVTVDTAETAANLATLGGYGGLKEGLADRSAYDSPIAGLSAYGRGVRNFVSFVYYDPIAKAKSGEGLSATLQHTKDITGWTKYEQFGTHLGEGKYLEASGDLLVGMGQTAGTILAGKGAITAGQGLLTKTEAGVESATAPSKLTNREYISDEVTTQAREARNAPNAAKISTDVPADNYNHGPFVVPEESSASAASYGSRSMGAAEKLGYKPGEVLPTGQIAGSGPGAALRDGAEFGATAEEPPILLGESMDLRVKPVAGKIGADVYEPPPDVPENWLRNNVSWIKEQIASGRRILDIGVHRGRPSGRSPYYTAEKESLTDAGYQRTFVGWTRAAGKNYRIYEWQPPR